MRKMRAFAVLLGLTACQFSESPDAAEQRMAKESAVAKTAIDAINVRYARFLSENLADSTAMLFMENGVMMPPNAPAVVGRAAILKFLTDNPGPVGSSYVFTSLNVQANGPMAVERGTYSFSMPASDSAPAISVPGKYLVHWNLVDGVWLQSSTSWSDNAPMPPPM